MPIISEQILYCILNNLDKRHVFKFKYECKYPCCTALGWQGLNIWMCTLCSSRTDGSLARARHQRVTSDPCFHFFAFYPHQGNPPTTTVRHLFRCFDEPLIECSDIGGFGSRCQVAMMMEPDSSLAPVDATLSTPWLWCGQPVPIPTDQHPAICVAPTWKNCFTAPTVG